MAKAKTTKTTTTPATTPATEPKATKKASKKVAPKKEEAPVVVPEVTNEVVETPVVSNPADDAASLSAQMSELMTVFQRLSTEARAAATKLRALDKQYQRTLRLAQKKSNKKRKNCGAPSPASPTYPSLLQTPHRRFRKPST